MTAGSEVNVEPTPHHPAVDNPDTDAILQFLPEPLMYVMPVGQLLAALRQAPDISRAAAFLALGTVGLDERFRIALAGCHQPVFHKEVLDEEAAFVMLCFLVNPQL
jgi:hypothetical protein